MGHPRRISLVLPMAGIAGGVKVVFQHAEHLHRLGHRVMLYYPGVIRPRRGAPWRIEAQLRHVKYRAQEALGRSEARRWFPLSAPIRHVPSLEARYLQPADIVVATGVDTAPWVIDLPADRGEKLYFIQDIEDWDVGEAAALATWRLPFSRRITVSRHLQAMGDAFGVRMNAVVPNGVDTATFYPEPRTSDSTAVRVLALWHRDARKGLADWFAALERIRAVVPGLQPVFFGASPPLAGTLPAGAEFHLRPSAARLRALYSGADIYVSASLHEGFGLTPLEAMACGCAVVATTVGAVPDYADDGVHAVLVAPARPDALAAAVLRLLRDPAARAAIGRAAAVRARTFALESSSRRFAQALLSDD